MMDEVVALIWSAVGVLVTGLMSWLTARIIAWLNSKIKDRKLAKYSSDITEIVLSAVQRVFQTYVETMKKNGTFTEEAQKEALAKAKVIISSELTDELKDYITENYGDINEYINTQIEAMIYRLKQ